MLLRHLLTSIVVAAPATAAFQTGHPPEAPPSVDPEPSGGRRAVASSAGSALEPRLLAALDRIHGVDRACLSLGILGLDGGVAGDLLGGLADEDREALEVVLLEGREGVFRGALAFDFGDGGAALEEWVECIRYDAAAEAAAALTAAAPAMVPGVVLDRLRDDFLTAEPVEGSELALALHGIGQAQGRFAPLGNGASCYLAWGLLWQDTYWEGQDAARGVPAGTSRDDFVGAVLDMSGASELALLMSLRVLQAPLPVGDEFPGRGIAFPQTRVRGKLGFSAAHQAFVTGIRAELAGELAADPRRPRVTIRGVELDARAVGEWAAEMLGRILRDRGTVAEADAVMRRGSLAERLTYWSDLERSASFEAFREAYLDELALIAAAADELPGQGRVDELLGVLEVRDLTEAETRELEALQRTLRDGRRRMVQALGQLLIRSGGQVHFAAVAQALAGPTEELLANFCAPQERRNLFGRNWITLASGAGAQAGWVLEDHLSGARTLPRYGIDTLLMNVSGRAAPHEMGTLRRFLDEGSAVERASVLCNGDWVGDAEFRVAYGRLRRDEGNVARSRAERDQLGWAMMGAITTRRGPLARELLLESFREGRWKADRGPLSWAHRPRCRELERLLGTLDEAERAALVERGLAPPGLFR